MSWRSVAVKEDAIQHAVHFPGTGEQISSLQEDDPAAVANAVECARSQFQDGAWSRASTATRQRVFRRAATLIREHADTLGLLECLCAGLPSSHLASRQVPRAADNLDFFADYIGVMAGETFEQLPGYQTSVTRQPAGVAALFAPWNAPLALASMQIASSLAFGNTCVLKPSEFTPLSILKLVALMEEAGLPPGTINIVNGSGAVTGAALAGSPDIDRIAFTGGGGTARQVMTAAASHLTPVHFELGGKSANIVFDDADMERAVDGSLVNIFSNSGQICIAGSRILVQRGIAERFSEAFVARTEALIVGNPLEAQTEVGPMAFKAHWQRVLDHIERAKLEGATLLCGERHAPIWGMVTLLRPLFFRSITINCHCARKKCLGLLSVFRYLMTTTRRYRSPTTAALASWGTAGPAAWPERKPFNNRLTLEHYGSIHRSRGTCVLPSVVSKSQALAATGPVKPLTSSPRKRPPSLPWVTRPFAN